MFCVLERLLLHIKKVNGKMSCSLPLNAGNLFILSFITQYAIYLKKDTHIKC